MQLFKLATVQFSPVFGNPEKTIQKLKPLMEEARAANLVVLPELANSGYNFSGFEQAFAFSETPENSKFVDFIATQCARYNYAVVTGFNERAKDQIFNSALLINETGIVGKYRKIQLFMNEKEYFTPGDSKPELYDINGVKVGILICFDWLFAELWIGLAKKGADVICHPSNLVLPGKAQKAIPVWASTNRVFIATANRIGTEGELTFTGNSIIAAPSGELIASASSKKEEVIMADCDTLLARNKMITPQNHAFNDRRAEMYDL